MENFVNREEELQHVDEHLDALLKNDMLSTQIIEFHGVGGVGKTTILKKVEQRCYNMQLPCIWTDANQSVANFARSIIRQVQNYPIPFIPQGNDWPTQSISATQALIAQGPTIMLVDSLDTASEELLIWIEHMLQRLTEYGKLLVVLASKKIIAFKRTMSVARKLLPLQLTTFNREVCTAYLHGIEQKIEPEISNIVFAWTNGYPLAMNVMFQAILNDKLDPRKEQDQKQLLAIITEQVINRGVLSTFVRTPIDPEWYQTMLSLFSTPRSFNIPIMQDIIEEFAPLHKLSSRLAYMTLPKRINQATDVLNWNPSKAGYSLEAPIRHIFLIKLKIEQPELYVKLHSFLAQIMKKLASEVSGTDRVRCWKEYLYHSANCSNEETLQQIVIQTVQQIVNEPSEYFQHFHEEYTNDEELKTALGACSVIVISLIYKQLAMMNRQLATEASNTERIFYWREFFYYIILDPMTINLPPLLKGHVQQVAQEESHEVCTKLYEQLSQDIEIREKLGEAVALLSSLVYS